MRGLGTTDVWVVARGMKDLGNLSDVTGVLPVFAKLATPSMGVQFSMFPHNLSGDTDTFVQGHVLFAAVPRGHAVWWGTTQRTVVGTACPSGTNSAKGLSART